MSNDNLVIVLVTLCGLVLLPWWLVYLWRSLHEVIKHWQNKSQKPEVEQPSPPKQPLLDRKPILFVIGTLIMLVGFALIILFRDNTFLWLVVAGILYLSALFFRCYFLTISQTERTLLSEGSSRRPDTSDPEQLYLFIHSHWMFDRPGLFYTGFFFIPLGVFLALTSADMYLLLLSIYGLIFLLQVWSFSQLNILTVTDRRTTLLTGLPADDRIEIRHEEVTSLRTRRSPTQHLFRTWTLVIAGAEDQEMILHLKHPDLVTDLIKQYRSPGEQPRASTRNL